MRAANDLGGPLRRGRALALLAVVLFAPCASADEAEPATDNALGTLCGIVEASAKAEGLPVNFFTRLIWRESAFRTDAVSPAGAEGVAQFMPGTASERGSPIRSIRHPPFRRRPNSSPNSLSASVI